MNQLTIPLSSSQLINQTSGKFEYRTPLYLVAAARRVMGSIDLDVATTEAYNEAIGAAAIFTLPPYEVIGHMPHKGEAVPVWKFAHLGALAQPWYGRVWMNHPFGGAQAPCKHGCVRAECLGRGWHTATHLPGNEAWITKPVKEYESGRVTSATCITFAATSEGWARPLLRFPVCFLQPRTNYLDAQGNEVKGVTKGSMVAYLGPDVEAFASEYARYGEVKVSVSGRGVT